MRDTRSVEEENLLLVLMQLQLIDLVQKISRSDDTIAACRLDAVQEY